MGYVRSNFGQVGVPVTPASEGTAVFKASSLPEIVTGPALPTASGSYYTRFRRVASSQPSSPYEYAVPDSEVERQIYKDLPTSVPGAGSNFPEPDTQQVVKTPSGLDVPVYILQRDAARRQAAQEEAERRAKKSKVSRYTENHPRSAALAAIAMGLLSGNFLF